MSAGSTVSAPPNTPRESWPPPQGLWTYADYARLPDNGMRYEVLEGNLHMSPAPRIRHQEILGELYGHIRNHLKQLPIGKAFIAPVDVRLQAGNLESTVQPDLVFVCQARLIVIVEDQCINGAPDLVVEILSPNRESYDRREKYQTYASAGVSEYWIIDPTACTLEVNVLRGEAYVPVAVFNGRDQVRSEALPELILVAADIFPTA